MVLLKLWTCQNILHDIIVKIKMKYYYPPKIENLPATGIDEEFGDVEFAALEEERENNLELIDLSEPPPIIYFHGHHSNPCVVGEIFIPLDSGSEVIVITHNMKYEDYGDNLCDITKVWDAQVQAELIRFDRYDTHYDTCIHIPLHIGENTSLSNQVLKQILLDRKSKFCYIFFIL